MITEDYVSFETAKLLKEKGFDEYCKSVYHIGSVCSVASLGYYDKEEYGAAIEEKQNSDFGKYDNAISAPTLQMAMKWLREVHNQHIVVEAYNYMARLRTDYYVEIQNLNEPTAKNFCVNGCMRKRTYEEACEAAIKYCIENLI